MVLSMYIDFHTHMLPGIDDGAKDVDMSVIMLESAAECGAETVILTPHVNSSADFGEFLRARDKSFNKLKKAIKTGSGYMPELLLGAEVLLDGPLSEKDDVCSLCIDGTELLLLELPYTPWSSWYNHEIYNIISKHNVTPVMAHIERYLKNPKDIKKLDTLISFGVKFQINVSSFLSFSGRRIIRELAAEGLISAIGSDAHNLTNRPADITKALNAFRRKFGDDFIDHIYNKTIKLIDTHAIK